MTGAPRPAPAITILIAGLLLGACGETTVDPTLSTLGGVTTTVAPLSTPLSGTAAELLAELSTAAGGLSAAVIDNEGDEALLARIEALWAAARDEVLDTRSELVDDFDGAVQLAATGVQRRRPADADKAFRNLSSLVDAYLGAG